MTLQNILYVGNHQSNTKHTQNILDKISKIPEICKTVLNTSKKNSHSIGYPKNVQSI